MDNHDQNIDRLRQTIETQVDRKMRTPKDFDYLSEQIFEKLHQTVSPTTLKRLWGYLSETAVPRPSTLNILSQFIDYESWDAFSQSDTTAEPSLPEQPEQESASHTTSQPAKRRSRGLWIVFALIAVVIAIFAWNHFKPSVSASDTYILKIGDRFGSYPEYLKLFGINDTTNYWGRVLPHHPNIVVWGPEYQHPHWHNYGNKDSLMPTITERWEPADADSQMVTMRNRDKYHHELRLNEVRITFMKNLVDTGYVFVGIYRLSLPQSDTNRCVWERIADECDLSRLDYLDELRN